LHTSRYFQFCPSLKSSTFDQRTRYRDDSGGGRFWVAREKITEEFCTFDELQLVVSEDYYLTRKRALSGGNKQWLLGHS
jgi:hypothetical protein